MLHKNSWVTEFTSTACIMYRPIFVLYGCTRELHGSYCKCWLWVDAPNPRMYANHLNSNHGRCGEDGHLTTRLESLVFNARISVVSLARGVCGRWAIHLSCDGWNAIDHTHYFDPKRWSAISTMSILVLLSTSEPAICHIWSQNGVKGQRERQQDEQSKANVGQQLSGWNDEMMQYAFEK